MSTCHWRSARQAEGPSSRRDGGPSFFGIDLSDGGSLDDGADADTSAAATSPASGTYDAAHGATATAATATLPAPVTLGGTDTSAAHLPGPTHKAFKAAPFPMAKGQPSSTSGISSTQWQLARQPTSGSTSTASVMGVVVMAAQKMVVASSRRGRTTGDPSGVVGGALAKTDECCTTRACSADSYQQSKASARAGR